MLKDNKGLSLVEVIVVVTILGILSLGGVLGLNAVSGKPAKQCTENIKVVLNNDRSMAMGKYMTELYITSETDGIYATENVYTNASTFTTKKTKIGDKNVDLSYCTDGASYGSLPSAGVKLEFDRASGSLKGGTDYYFKATKANKDYFVTLHHLTGKVELN